jgi:hypothetical protein
VNRSQSARRRLEATGTVALPRPTGSFHLANQSQFDRKGLFAFQLID